MRRLIWTLVPTLAAALAACVTPQPTPAPAVEQVLFVCEHGNVKSLMATTYFNELASKRRLPYRAVSRGVSPDSTSVPPKIASALDAEGFDGSGYHPSAVSASDVTASERVIAIGVALPSAATPDTSTVEQWNDVPAASVDYAAARAALKAHVEDLIERMSREKPTER
jgi:arsenate reductase